MENINWVVLIYKVPSEPTKYRATVWREIKKLGGVYLQNGVCIFPDVDDVSLNVGSLANQIRDMNGTEYLFFTKCPTREQARDLVEQFQSSRDEEYQIVLEQTDQLLQQCSNKTASAADSLTGLNEEFLKLKKQVQLIKARDYFMAPLGETVVERLQSIRNAIMKLSKGGYAS